MPTTTTTTTPTASTATARAPAAAARATKVRAIHAARRRARGRARPGTQLALEDVVASTGKRNWGGKRPGAGRKLAPGARPSVPHRARPKHEHRSPVHVTLRAQRGLPSLRSQRILGMLQSVLITQRKRKYAGTFQVVHFSVQRNHVHMIVESATALRAGVSGFVISFAKRLNMLLGRRGKVWGDRFHARALTSPAQVRNALVYVFGNDGRHGTHAFGDGAVDLYSSATRFEGWRRPLPFTEQTHDFFDATGSPWVRLRWPPARPRTWLLGTGWRTRGTRGLIDPREVTHDRRPRA